MTENYFRHHDVSISSLTNQPNFDEIMTSFWRRVPTGEARFWITGAYKKSVYIQGSEGNVDSTRKWSYFLYILSASKMKREFNVKIIDAYSTFRRQRWFDVEMTLFSVRTICNKNETWVQRQIIDAYSTFKEQRWFNVEKSLFSVRIICNKNETWIQRQSIDVYSTFRKRRWFNVDLALFSVRTICNENETWI
jgi:hypothetical protein